MRFVVYGCFDIKINTAFSVKQELKQYLSITQ